MSANQPIIVPFPRPDGEARLEWVESQSAFFSPDGGHVRIRIHPSGDCYTYYAHVAGKVSENLSEHVTDPSPILLAAEKLRNEKRKLAKDGSEWRSSNYFFTWSNPTLEGCTETCFALEDGKVHSVTRVTFAGLWHGSVKPYVAALKSWHRTAFLPLLPDDYAYPEGELPRLMQPDEVRGVDGSALRVRIQNSSLTGKPFVSFDRYDGSNVAVWPSGKGSIENGPFWSLQQGLIEKDHPLLQAGQLARLQAFWDANQPKEAELNLRWHAYVPKLVEFDFGGTKGWLYNGHWSPSLFDDMSPSQRATVESFFAAGPPKLRDYQKAYVEELGRAAGEIKPGEQINAPLATDAGPPVELAEDEFLHDVDGEVHKMRVAGDRLEIYYPSDREWSPWTGDQLAHMATDYISPLGWPRALAYFDRHVGKPEPARVTDVRWNELVPACAEFRLAGEVYAFYGTWNLTTRDRLHPLDIALIERCWAEGQRPACVPADVTEWTRIEGRVVWRAGSGQIRISGCEKDHWPKMAWIMWPESRLGEFDCTSVAPSLFHAARKWAGWDVTPSGEVKALCPNCRSSYDPRQGHSCRLPVTPAPDLTELREAREKQMAYLSLSPDSRSPLQETVNVRAVFAAVERLVGK